MLSYSVKSSFGKVCGNLRTSVVHHLNVNDAFDCYDNSLLVFLLIELYISIMYVNHLGFNVSSSVLNKL